MWIALLIGIVSLTLVLILIYRELKVVKTETDKVVVSPEFYNAAFEIRNVLTKMSKLDKSKNLPGAVMRLDLACDKQEREKAKRALSQYIQDQEAGA